MNQGFIFGQSSVMIRPSASFPIPVAMPLRRNGIQRQLRARRFRPMHGTGFRPQQIDFQFHFQLYAEASIIRTNITACKAHTGHNEQAAALVLAGAIADLRFHYRSHQMDTSFPIANLTANRNGYPDMLACIRCLTLLRRPPRLCTALLNGQKTIGRTTLQTCQFQLGAQLRNIPFLTAYDLLQKYALTLRLRRFHRRLLANHPALMRRRAGLDGFGPW